MPTNDHDSQHEAALAPFFAAARATAPEPDAGLMARVLADAQAMQAEQAALAAAVAARTAAPRAGVWARLAQGLGGWPAMAGLAAAGVAGVWIGGALPATLPGLALDADDYLVDVAPELALETGGGL